MEEQKKMRRVAVIGGGISGLGASYELAKAGYNVVLYEKETCLGGHAKTVTFDAVDLDLGFMASNWVGQVSYPNLGELFDNLGFDVEARDMSLSVSLDRGQGYEWGSRNGQQSIFAQKSNACRLNFWKMLNEVKNFKEEVIMFLNEFDNNSPDKDHIDQTLGQFIKSKGYSELFLKAYLVPMCASIWSCPADRVMDLSAFTVLTFCLNQNLLQVFGHSQWLTVRGRLQHFVKKLQEELEARGCQIKTSCEVQSVSTSDKGCTLFYGDDSKDVYDECILAVPPPDALRILGKEVTHDEVRILGAFQYTFSDAYLHRDKSLMPQNPVTWGAWNFVESTKSDVCLTYWLNLMQNISETSLPFFVTLNPPQAPQNVLCKWATGCLVPSVAARKASLELDNIQGKRGIWFCGAYHGYGFHEDGLKAGMVAVNAMLGRSFSLVKNPKQMVLSWTESAARHVVVKYLKQFISAGRLMLLEDGGSVLVFGSSDERCTWKSALRVHSPQFYLKVATEAELGFADAYINGDVSVVDKDDGLLNFFMIILANTYLYPSTSELVEERVWWKPILFTAGVASAKYYFQHLTRRNSVRQARQNIARHYDLSNDMFSLFLDETMTYSCAIFKSETEDLKDAQLRKTHLLIDKARVEKDHELLDIGCGWGTLAIEAVKKTGCRYTGITLSEEQLKHCEQKVKEAGLEDRIRFLLCDYRQLSATHKFNRIISCGMLEHVGDEYYEDFFRHSESLLTDDGLLVLQFISVPDQWYELRRKSSGFITEYIFPGGCLPSLNRLLRASTSASRLCVEHVENIGIHYYQTLRCWRKKFLEHRSKMISLGFNDKFIRTWEYYFDYCASGFKTRTAGDYQIVLSRPGNLVAFSDPYASIPSTHCYQ